MLSLYSVFSLQTPVFFIIIALTEQKNSRLSRIKRSQLRWPRDRPVLPRSICASQLYTIKIRGLQKEDYPSVRCTSDDTADGRFTIHRWAFSVQRNVSENGREESVRIDEYIHPLSGLRLTLMAALKSLNAQLIT